MRTLSKLLSQRGMSLMEIMVGAALMGGIALVGAKMMDDQASNQAYIKTKASIASKISRLEFFLSNPETCKLILAGKLVPSTLGTPSFKDPSVLSYSNPINGSLVNLLGETTYGDYSVPDGGVTLQNSAFGDKVVEVAIKFDVENKSSFRKGSASYTRKIQIVAQRSGGAIEACGPVLKDSETAGKEKMCNTLGAAAAWNGTDCVLVGFQCPTGEVVNKVNNLADFQCDPIKDKINLPDIFDTASTACGPNPQIQIVESGGKFKLSCGSTTCTSCTAIAATYCPADPAQFNSCGVSCGTGTKSSGCSGAVVNGGWSDWQVVGTCNIGSDQIGEERFCNNPAPANGGTTCVGPNTRTRQCECMENLSADSSKEADSYFCCLPGYYPMSTPFLVAQTDCYGPLKSYYNPGTGITVDSWHCTPSSTQSAAYAKISSQCEAKGTTVDCTNASTLSTPSGCGAGSEYSACRAGTENFCNCSCVDDATGTPISW